MMRSQWRVCWLLCVGLLSACSGGGGDGQTSGGNNQNSPPPPSAFVYTSSNTQGFSSVSLGGNVSGFRVVGDNGVLGPVSSQPFKATGVSESIIAHPRTSLLYVLNSGTIDVFQRGADGGLQRLSSHVFLPGFEASSVCAHPTGKWLYIFGDLPLQFRSIILVLPIIESGLDAGKVGNFLQTFPVSVLGQPSSCIISGDRLYGASAQAGAVFSVTIAGDGTLTSTSNNSDVVIRSGGPGYIVKHPLRPFVYVAYGLSDGIDKFAINPGGGLTFVSRFDTGVNPTSIAIDTRGQFLYATNKGSNSISGYRIVDSGDLTPLTPASFPTNIAPRSAIFDPSGNSLYVAFGSVLGSGLDGSIQSFSVNRNTGELVPRSTWDISGLPTQVISVLP